MLTISILTKVYEIWIDYTLTLTIINKHRNMLNLSTIKNIEIINMNNIDKHLNQNDVSVFIFKPNINVDRINITNVYEISLNNTLTLTEVNKRFNI